MSYQLPNFYILGAGRCGTTTLYDMLVQHPDVYFPSRKEPTFFSDPHQMVRSPIRYASLYDDAKAERRRGDASHAYLTHPEAAETIRAFTPDARFIVILRHPADRALALYSWMTVRGREYLPTFEAALAAEERRFTSTRFAHRHRHHALWNFFYFRSGLFGEQVERYVQRFSEQQFFFTTLAELVANPEKVTTGLHEFLDIEPLPLDEAPKSNPSVGVRFPVVRWAEESMLGAGPVPRIPGTQSLRRAIDKANAAPKAEMQRGTREQLVARYESDLRKLADLTGVELIEEP